MNFAFFSGCSVKPLSESEAAQWFQCSKFLPPCVCVWGGGEDVEQ